jgi:hypothetical protein
MSKLARVLTLAAMLAAINLVGVTAIAQAHTSHDPASKRHHALGQMEFRATAAQQQATADATVQRLLARERFYSTWGYGNPATQQALAQERAYRTSGYRDPTAPPPAPPSRQPDRRLPALGVLAAVGALAAGVAVLAARRATRTHRASQTA